MKYEIDDQTFAVSIFEDGESVPFWFQPDYPNYDKFDSYEEAEEWAKLAVLSHNENYAYFAPEGKGIAGKPKPTEEERAAARLKRESMK